MKITKLGHCCLLIEHKGKRILTDPGLFTVDTHSSLTDIDVVFISHEHGDHIHTDSLKQLLKLNQNAVVVTNSSVSKLLPDPVTFVDVEALDNLVGIPAEFITTEHAEIFGDFGNVDNTALDLDGGQFFYSGDAFTKPNSDKVNILAVPIAGPWMALREAITYTNELKPKTCFPVHDGVLSEVGKGVHNRVFAKNLSDEIRYKTLTDGESFEA